MASHALLAGFLAGGINRDDDVAELLLATDIRFFSDRERQDICRAFLLTISRIQLCHSQVIDEQEAKLDLWHAVSAQQPFSECYQLPKTYPGY